MDEQGVLDFLMKLTGDAAAAAGGLSVAIGDRLAGPSTAVCGDRRVRRAAALRSGRHGYEPSRGQ